jgi:glycine hydroxymethyltransferase
MERGLTLVTGGTDNHLVLVDLRPQNVSGKDVEERLEAAGIIANRNTVPNDPRPPREASGLRLGSPALTTRGLGEAEFKQLANAIADVVLQPGDASQAAATKLAQELTKAFPLYK